MPKGDKAIITLPDTTKTALEALLTRLVPKGRIILVCYYGHAGGEAELKEVHSFCQQLPQEAFNVLSYQFINQRNQPPILFCIERKNQLALLAVDHAGLDYIDQKLIRTMIELYQGGPVGLSTIAVNIGEETETVEDMYEPFLIQKGFLKRTSRSPQCVPTYRSFDQTPQKLGSIQRIRQIVVPLLGCGNHF